jgi:hypothetical protein
MKCIRCQHDSKYKDRKDGACPKCRHRFAFEPKNGARLTDQAFQNAIDRVSGNGTLRWGAEHLYYEVARRLRPRLWLRTRNSQIVGVVVATAGLFMLYQLGLVLLVGGLIVVSGMGVTRHAGPEPGRSVWRSTSSGRCWQPGRGYTASRRG